LNTIFYSVTIAKKRPQHRKSAMKKELKPKLHAFKTMLLPYKPINFQRKPIY